MPTLSVVGPVIRIETDQIAAEVHTEGYVSGIARGSFLDKKTGARDVGFGLDIIDFLLEPKPDDISCPPHLRYGYDSPQHGGIVKRYVETPQICTGAKKLSHAVVRTDRWVAVRQWFRYQEATYGRDVGSLWEQTLLFVDGCRYFFAADYVTSANDVKNLILRLDMPGHFKHKSADTFSEVYLSYHGRIPAKEFLADFGPEERFLYRRDDAALPKRMVRGCRLRGEDGGSPWLAGMTLDPSAVYEAWCHQRGYVCMIQEIGGRAVRKGGRFGACNLIGYFDDIDDMKKTYDRFHGVTDIEFFPHFSCAEGVRLVGPSSTPQVV